MIEIKDGDIWKPVKVRGYTDEPRLFYMHKEREYEKTRLMERDQTTGLYECHET